MKPLYSPYHPKLCSSITLNVKRIERGVRRELKELIKKISLNVKRIESTYNKRKSRRNGVRLNVKRIES